MCTGGEPFSFQENLSTALQAIRQEGLVSYTLTSGAWAKTPKRASEVLDALPPIDLFAVSIDVYHKKVLGFDPPLNALRAAVEHGSSVFVCIGHMGLNDPFREEVTSKLDDYLRSNIEIIYYPLLARGSGSNLPELQGRELSRPATQPCFSIGAPLITANGELVACCHTSEANKARTGRRTPLVFGNGSDFNNGVHDYLHDPFALGMRTVGPVELAEVAEIETPHGFADWDICAACEFLQSNIHQAKIVLAVSSGKLNRMRLEMLDEVFSEGSSTRLRKHLTK